MPSINAFDAGKRQMNASKTFPERQPAEPQARQASSVGCLLLRRGGTDFQSVGPSLPDVEVRSRSGALCDPSGDQYPQVGSNKVGLHLRAVREGGVSPLWPQKLEAINGRDSRAARQNSPRLRVWREAAPCNPARGASGFPRSEGVRAFAARGCSSPLVPERNLQTRPFGWSRSHQSSSRVEDPKKVSAGPIDEATDRTGGKKLSECARFEGK